MSDNKVYSSVNEVLTDLASGLLNQTQAAAWIEGMKARNMGFTVRMSSGNKANVRCKGTPGKFGLTLYAVTMAEILLNADKLRDFLASNIDTLELRPQDRETVEKAILG